MLFSDKQEDVSITSGVRFKIGNKFACEEFIRITSNREPFTLRNGFILLTAL